jgi:RND family efflux transporter MFP subunit
VPLVVVGVVVAMVALMVFMQRRAEDATNKVALSSTPRPVTVVEAKAAQFQPTRTYVGTLEPWVESKVGPQFVSAYVSTVLVRPGAVVKKGAVLATLDCRSANATAQAIEMQALALTSQQKALADESARINAMLDGGYVSPTEAETKSAQSDSKQAEFLAARARLLDTGLQVSDCVLRSPFDGEVGNRWLDPGAFVRPGQAIVSVIDRSTVRYVADVPEDDFAVAQEGRSGKLKLFATKTEFTASVSRRAPSADPATRTVHIEVDLPNPQNQIPVYTTGEFTLGVGKPSPATELPLASATIRGKKATVYVVDGEVAHVRPLQYLGEQGGSVFVDTSLAAGTHVVTEGRALLSDGDPVRSKLDVAPATTAPPPAEPVTNPGAQVSTGKGKSEVLP